MSSKDYIQSKDEELATHGSHYNLMKGSLQEKKRIGVLLSSLPSISVPLGLHTLRKPKTALLNSFSGLG